MFLRIAHVSARVVASWLEVRIVSGGMMIFLRCALGDLRGVRHLRHSKSDASIRNRWYCCIPDPVRMHHTSHRYGKPADAVSVRQYRRLLVGALLPTTRVLACRIQWTQSEYQSRQRLHESSFYTIAVDLYCNQVLSRHADCTVGVKLSLSGDRPLLGYLV